MTVHDFDDKEALVNDRNQLGNFHKEINALMKVKVLGLFQNFKTEYVRENCNLSKEELIHRLSVIDELTDYVNKNY